MRRGKAMPPRAMGRREWSRAGFNPRSQYIAVQLYSQTSLIRWLVLIAVLCGRGGGR